MFTKNNHVSSQYRLRFIQLLEQGIGGRTTRTPFGSEQLDQHRRSTIASRKIRGNRERGSCPSYEKSHENRECDSEPHLHSDLMPIKRPFAGRPFILTLIGAPPQLKCSHPHHSRSDGRPSAVQAERSSAVACGHSNSGFATTILTSWYPFPRSSAWEALGPRSAAVRWEKVGTAGRTCYPKH